MQPPVPHYALYGDQQGALLEEFFHCETIAIRSRRHDWEIAPHLHPALSQMLFVARGAVDVRLGDVQRRLAGPLLVSVPSGLVHGFRFSPAVVGFVVTASQDFLDSLARQDALRVQMRTAATHRPANALTRGLLQVGRQLLIAEQDRFDPDAHRLHRTLAEAWLRLAIQPGLARNAMRGTIPQRFQALVETSYRERRPLAFYAAQLGCTVRTLSRQTEAAFGMSPLHIINRRLLLEARRLLRFTSASCSEVAGELGFEDPAYFSRVYRRMIGRSPSEDRKAR
ncbi:MAG TPA: helix-turn-helix domain-containing protein [Sphingobium sp.]|nr:helix-turn-helix domain-containing protein [Sphingobium sp.]